MNVVENLDGTGTDNKGTVSCTEVVSMLHEMQNCEFLSRVLLRSQNLC